MPSALTAPTSVHHTDHRKIWSTKAYPWRTGTHILQTKTPHLVITDFGMYMHLPHHLMEKFHDFLKL